VKPVSDDIEVDFEQRLRSAIELLELLDNDRAMLAQLPDEELATLMDQSEEVEFAVKDQLFEYNEIMDRVYFPLTGMISLVIVLKNGTMIEALTVGREGFSGPAILNEVTKARYRAVCQIEGKFLAVRTNDFRSLVDKLPGLRRKVHRYAQYASDVTAQSVACNSIHTIEQRCARWLLITSDAINELKLHRGDDALAIIKSTEVMIAREAETADAPAKRRRARR